MDKPKMVWAGVDAGAKIFVELNGESGAAAAVAMKQYNRAKFRIPLRVAELFPYRMFHTGRARIGCGLLEAVPAPKAWLSVDNSVGLRSLLATVALRKPPIS
jgi:hypothetical protein